VVLVVVVHILLLQRSLGVQELLDKEIAVEHQVLH
jgi:hypothetical protein